MTLRRPLRDDDERLLQRLHGLVRARLCRCERLSLAHRLADVEVELDLRLGAARTRADPVVLVEGVDEHVAWGEGELALGAIGCFALARRSVARRRDGERPERAAPARPARL